jgi:hypothetical protein
VNIGIQILYLLFELSILCRVETKIFVFAFSRKFSRKYILVFRENFTTKIDENNENFRENAFLSLLGTKLQFSNDF